MIPILLDNKVNFFTEVEILELPVINVNWAWFYVLAYKRYKGKIIETCKMSWVNKTSSPPKKEYITKYEDLMRKYSIFFLILPS